jgi:glycosyltransferase involved in cell wall biosynthesis
MKISILTEYRFHILPNGTAWAQTNYDYAFWARYLKLFDEVHVLARAQLVTHVPNDYLRVDGDRVHFVALPYYVGFTQYLRQARALKAALKQALATPGVVLMYVPSQIATAAMSVLPAGYPYGLRVVGDPYDVFSSGAVRHPLRLLFRQWFVQNLRRQCLGACAVAYVNSQILQQRYPANPKALVTYYSNVHLQDAFVETAHVYKAGSRPNRLVFVGSLAQMYKGPDTLIEAIDICRQQGVLLHLTIIGDGKHRPEIEADIAARNLGAQVILTGMLSGGKPVRDQLDQADLFVLPSRTEGLPRAMVEAMARGLPCIGTAVGGIPDLLPPEDMVPPSDAQSLAKKILEVVSTPERMTAMAARNLEKSYEFKEETLDERRFNFLQYIRDNTEARQK